MERVTGIGGTFFRAKDAPSLRDWHQSHLGVDVHEWGGTASTWTDTEGKSAGGMSVWSIGPVKRHLLQLAFEHASKAVVCSGPQATS